MPIYEYLCEDCSTRYERLVLSPDVRIVCPQCGSERHVLQVSLFRAARNRTPAGTDFFVADSGCGCTPVTCGCK